ncbi:MAG: cation transporter [Pseudomonadales bacterium]|nr:cation transporter [Pseudomonadales bacterium]
MSHDHVHMPAETKDKRVAIAIWANGILTLAQIGGGIFAGSLALIADALHNFSDMASLFIALAAQKIARRPADARMTFGYGRIEIVAALINYTTLIIIGFYLIYEGGMRIIDPPEVKGWWVVWLGGIALAVDALTALLTYSMQKDSVNIRALFLHNLSDTLASVAVVIGGTLILLYDMRWVDPAITIGIAGYILYLGLTEIGGTIRTLMLGSPVDIDTDAVIVALSNIEGVIDIHHVHFWQMGEHDASLEAHVIIEESAWDQLENIKYRIKQALAQEFNISHSTLEFEHPDHVHKDTHTYGHG